MLIRSWTRLSYEESLYGLTRFVTLTWVHGVYLIMANSPGLFGQKAVRCSSQPIHWKFGWECRRTTIIRHFQRDWYHGDDRKGISTFSEDEVYSNCCDRLLETQVQERRKAMTSFHIQISNPQMPLLSWWTTNFWWTKLLPYSTLSKKMERENVTEHRQNDCLLGK